MKFVIQTEKDLQQLQGKIVIQVDATDPDKTLMEFGWEFAKEKRLRLVAGTYLISLYGDIRTFDTFERFKNYFNSYLFDHMIANGETDGGRFHRLLTSKELDYLIEKIKQENY